MRVYLVEEGVAYEYDAVVGIFASQESALRAARAVMEAHGTPYDTFANEAPRWKWRSIYDDHYVSVTETEVQP